MRRTTRILFIVATLLLSSTAWSQAERFQVGQRVFQLATKSTGTITAIDPAKRLVQVTFDDRPGEGKWFHMGTPELQPSESAQPLPQEPVTLRPTQPTRTGKPSALSVLRPTKPQQEAEVKAYEPMAPVGGPLDETIAKRLIEDSLRKPVDQRIESVSFVWKGLTISAPRRLGSFEANALAISAGTEAFPVKADFSYTVTSLKAPADATTTDRVGFAYFYLDDFRHWTFTWYSRTGTVNAVRPK